MFYHDMKRWLAPIWLAVLKDAKMILTELPVSFWVIGLFSGRRVNLRRLILLWWTFVTDIHRCKNGKTDKQTMISHNLCLIRQTI